MAIGDESNVLVVCFLHTSGQILFVSDVWPAPATHHRPCCEHYCDQRVGRSPYRTRPVQIHDFMTQSLVVSINVCRGLGISMLRIKIWLSFFRPILAQDLPRNYFVRFFLKFGTFFFFKDLCPRRAVQRPRGGHHTSKYNSNSTIFLQHRVSIATGLVTGILEIETF